MEKYKFLAELGDGTCGSVYKAMHKETFEIVAVKKMKREFYYWEDCVILREVKALRKLNHPNIIKLLEIVQENIELFFIFEYLEHNLYEIIKDRQEPFSEEEIRCLMSQVLHGLVHVHKQGYFHRDLKPENLLVTNNKIKVADFGLARELSSLPPFTDYVATRWYRAPEVLLQSSSYTTAIDMWAVGAILAELFTLCPIFPGESEIDQLYKLCCVLGAPDWKIFPKATNMSRLVDITYSEMMPADFSKIIPHASLEAIDLIKICMRIPRAPADALKSNLGSEPNLKLNLWNFSAAVDDCFLGLTLAVNSSSPNLEKVKQTKSTKEDIMICPGFQDHSKESVFWSPFPSDQNLVTASVESSLSLSFDSVPHPFIGGSPFQSNTIDCCPLLAISSPLQQGHYYH